MSLYPAEGAHWCSRADYDAILRTVRACKAKRVLEFGPGTSTLAIIEGGAEYIDTCEDDDHWLFVWLDRLSAHPAVNVRRYTVRQSWPISIPTINGNRYDLGVVDGPKETGDREPVIDYALSCCDWVLVALEEVDSKGLRGVVRKVAHSRPVMIEETGPLAGAYALIGPPC